jgi:hypothetical protein
MDESIMPRAQQRQLDTARGRGSCSAAAHLRKCVVSHCTVLAGAVSEFGQKPLELAFQTRNIISSRNANDAYARAGAEASAAANRSS